MWSGIVWPAETHLADALKMHSQLWDFESIILAEPKERRSERWLWKAHTNSRRDGADGSLKFFVPPQPFPILRDVFYSHFAGGISSGVITEWEDLPKMAGEDSRIWKGWFRIPNPTSRDDPSWCGLTNPFSSGPVSLVYCSSITRGIGFSSPLTLRSCERTTVWDEPTPLMLWLCILWLDKRLSQSMLDMFSECRFSSKFKCLRTIELNVQVRTLPANAYLNWGSKDGTMGDIRTRKVSENLAGGQPMMHDVSCDLALFDLRKRI